MMSMAKKLGILPEECRHTNSLVGGYRVLTLDQKKTLSRGDIVYLQAAHCSHFLKVKITGKPKVWVSNAWIVRVPYKYGLYEYGTITEKDEVRIQLV